MMSELRFVLDTNLLVSAVLVEHSISREVFDLALKRGQALISDETRVELANVMLRKKFDRYISQEKRLRFLASFLRLAEPINVIEQIDVCRDPKDNKFLELAISGRATHIISGDDDLLVLHPFRDLSILTPRNFLTQFNNSQFHDN